MTDKPILFSAPMVRQIIREVQHPGTGKTQTRRIAKWSNVEPGLNLKFSALEARKLRTPGAEDGAWILESRANGGQWATRAKLRTYAPGDRLWVRETWAPWRNHEGLSGIDYRATPTCNDINRGWKPAIYMPRAASRLTLTVTHVRVQRLWDIDEADAIAEGAICAVMDDECKFYETIEGGSHRTGFAGLWQHINGRRDGCGWDDNPWVVAITFSPELRNIDAPATSAKQPAEVS